MTNPTHWNKDIFNRTLWINYSSNDWNHFGITFGWLRVMLWLGPVLVGVNIR